MRDLETAADAGNKKAILALKMYAYKVKKFIGSYMAALNGCDLLVLQEELGERLQNEKEYLFRHGKSGDTV